ncbi:hypothetical protein [Azospirillum sp. TSA2s]|nr:hypothetical protein [Azospirillum sp. TSA2s]
MTRSETLDAIAAEIDSALDELRARLWKAVRRSAVLASRQKAKGEK